MTNTNKKEKPQQVVTLAHQTFLRKVLRQGEKLMETTKNKGSLSLGDMMMEVTKNLLKRLLKNHIQSQ
jgi:hypothetical protein